jgi:predicted enzyme related to lactoylglutathione lyase
MHRSRLTNVVIDCTGADFERSAEFWAAAFGKRLMPRDERFVALRGRVGGDGGAYIGLQRVPRSERAVHLDIETDDVEAEVERLEGLGARVKARIRRHVVMEAPSGHSFCVVPVRRGDFPAGAVEWS